MAGSGLFISQSEFQSGLTNVQPENFEQIIEILNKRRQNNHLYIQLREQIPGTKLQGKTFQAVPPSILGQISSRNDGKKSSDVRERILAEKSIIADFAIQGGKTITLKVEK